MAMLTMFEQTSVTRLLKATEEQATELRRVASSLEAIVKILSGKQQYTVDEKGEIVNDKK